MSRAEKLPSLGSELAVFSCGWIWLTSSASGSATSRRRNRNLRKALHTLLNFLGLSGASPNQGAPDHRRRSSSATHVCSRASIDTDQFAFFNKQRYLNHFAGLQLGRLLHIGGAIAAQTFWRFDYFQGHR